MDFRSWRPYISVAERRHKASGEIEQHKKKGRAIHPVTVEGRTIATTFWGKSWCANLESYSDYANRLPRGRTYLRNGSVIDLQIGPGLIQALVSGSSLYEVTLKIKAVSKTHWKAICEDCAGAIDSIVELLQGRFSQGVMERMCRQKQGLFPSPAEIHLSCSCPDWAGMCKHVAAVLYGVGARIDNEPELLFRLREVDERDLIAGAGRALPAAQAVAADRILESEDLSELFGLDMALSESDVGRSPKKKASAKLVLKKQPVRKTAARKNAAPRKRQLKKRGS